MPTLATLLAAILNLRSVIDGAIARLIAMTGDLVADSLSLVERIVTAVYVPLDASLHAAINALTVTLVGDGTDPTPTLPAINTNVTNVYNIVSDGAADWTYIRNRVDQIWNIVARAYLCQAVVQTNMGNTLYHAPLTISASGTYSVTECDGLMVEVVSVPSSQGAEYADGFLRYPHIGWILGRLPFASWEARSDLVYLGPESHGFAWPGTRYVTEITVFLRPGVTITITPWSDVVTD